MQTATLTNVNSTTFDVANRVTSINGTALGYDNNGNLTTSGADTYTWNARNQLIGTSQGSEAFQYDALGRRRAKNFNTTYVYDGWNSITYNSSLILTGSKLDEIYTYVNSDGTTRSYIGDSLGSTLALTDSTGAITATYSYTPYGVPSEAGTDSTPRAFTGLEWESAPGLYHSRNRYYSPSLNRFISEDPMGLGGGINIYAYVGGNPIDRSDPLGLAYQIIVGGGGTAITPFFGGGLNFNIGFNIDGLNSSVYIQDQANIGVGTGAFVGLGLNLSIAHADAPTTGFDAQQYIEADIAKGPGIGASGTGNYCGGLDFSGARGLKPGVGLGAGVFFGNTYTATAVSPTIYTILNSIFASTVKTSF